MKKLSGVFLVLFGLMLFVMSNAQAVVFTPNPSDIGDFDHYNYYAWKIYGWSIPTDEVIDSAILKINQIDDWTNELNDHLYIHLMNSIPRRGNRVVSGGNTYQWTDNQRGGDNWSAWGPTIAVYMDNTVPASKKEDLSYSLNPTLLATLTTYINNDSNHTFYLGFDPDCHYYNYGVSFEIRTRAVPEPSTFLLLSAGLLGLGFAARRRK